MKRLFAMILAAAFAVSTGAALAADAPKSDAKAAKKKAGASAAE